MSSIFLATQAFGAGHLVHVEIPEFTSRIRVFINGEEKLSIKSRPESAIRLEPDGHTILLYWRNPTMPRAFLLVDGEVIPMAWISSRRSLRLHLAGALPARARSLFGQTISRVLKFSARATLLLAVVAGIWLGVSQLPGVGK